MKISVILTGGTIASTRNEDGVITVDGPKGTDEASGSRDANAAGMAQGEPVFPKTRRKRFPASSKNPHRPPSMSAR